MQNWEDSWLHGLGVEYKLSDSMKFRAGYTQDSTPIPSPEMRTPSQPEGDRTWVSFGFSYKQPGSKCGFDMGIQRQMVDDAAINRTIAIVAGAPTAVFGDTLRGNYTDSEVDLFGVQIRCIR